MIPSLRRLHTSALAAAFLALISLVACGSTTALTASDIVSQAQRSLIDATYIVTGASSADTSGSLFPFTANGMLTANPNRTDTTFTIQVAGNQVVVEQITDGQAIYEKAAPSSTWQKISKGDPSFSSIGTTDVLNFGKLQQVTLIGKETLAGVATYHLKANVVLPPAQGIETEELWIRRDNFYVQQIIQHVAGQTSSSSSVSISGDFSTKITFTKWNSGVKITVPSGNQVVTSNS